MTDELQRNPLEPEYSLYLGDLAIIQTNSNSLFTCSLLCFCLLLLSLAVRVQYA